MAYQFGGSVNTGIAGFGHPNLADRDRFQPPESFGSYSRTASHACRNTPRKLGTGALNTFTKLQSDHHEQNRESISATQQDLFHQKSYTLSPPPSPPSSPASSFSRAHLEQEHARGQRRVSEAANLGSLNLGVGPCHDLRVLYPLTLLGQSLQVEWSSMAHTTGAGSGRSQRKRRRTTSGIVVNVRNTCDSAV